MESPQHAVIDADQARSRLN